MKLKDRNDIELQCYVPDCKQKVIVYITGELTGELQYYCGKHFKENLKKDQLGTLQNLLS